MSEHQGWIKLHRKTKQCSFYKNPDAFLLWCHILLSVNHQEKTFLHGNQMVTLKPGQILTGRKALSAETGIQELKVKRLLDLFESEHQIEQQKTNKYSIITVLRWDEYQIIEQQNEQQMNNKRTTDEQQMNTNKNDKNEKNDKEELKKEINKEKRSKPRSAMTTIPDAYEISVQVREWATQNGITRLEERLAHFKDWATAGEKKYKDWDAAFRNALRGDWAKLNATPAKQQQFGNSEQPPTKQEIFKFAISQKDPLYKVNLDIFCSHYEKNGWSGDWKQNLSRWFARIMENENNPARRFLTKYETETVISFSEYQGPGVGQKPLPEIYGIKLPIQKQED